MRPEVLALWDHYNLMGMNVAEFSLPETEQTQPHQLIYTGTHDNQTMKGWYRDLPRPEQKKIRKKLAKYSNPRESISKKMVRFIYGSNCELAIVPVADILGLDDSARHRRLSQPGVAHGGLCPPSQRQGPGRGSFWNSPTEFNRRRKAEFAMKIKDIAQKAGVSTATVSNVINGNHHKVSQATIKKVQGIIAEMGYNPSATARSLASRESRIIGVVVPNLGPDQAFSVNAYNNQAIARLEQYVRNKGYYLMIRSVRECLEIVPIFSAWNVDGVIFLGAFQDAVPEIRERLNVPTVFIDTYVPGQPIANVGIDDYKGGYLMGRYLLGRGLSLPPESIFLAKTTTASGARAGQDIALSGRGFTAVAVTNDMTAIGVISGLRTCGVSVPEEMSVIGFDNLEAAKYMYPALTTIAQDIDKKCDTAGDILFRMIQTKEKIVVNEILDVELKERQSVKNLIQE